MKALTSRGRGHQPQPLDSMTRRARQQGEQSHGPRDRPDYHFPGPPRTPGFPREGAFGGCVCGRHSSKLDWELSSGLAPKL